MTHRAVLAYSFAYDFAPDDAPLVARRYWAIATAQVVDDVAGAPLAVPFRARVVPSDVGVSVKVGGDATFALVARPWLRFTPFGAAPSTRVRVEADGFMPLEHAFALAYDQRTVAAPAPNTGDLVVTLNSTANLYAGQTLLFGPSDAPQYARIRTVDSPTQVTLVAGLLRGHAVADPVFPDTFVSPAPVVLALRRAPVRIAGRVVVRDTTANLSTPVVGATIDVVDVWRTRAAVIADASQGAMTDPNPALRQFPVAVPGGVLAARAVGANVGDVALPLLADDRTLAQPASADDARLDVSIAQNLGVPPTPLMTLPNRLLLVEPTDPDAAEYCTLTAVRAVGTPSEPAQVDLDFPLRRAHAEDAGVSRVNAPVPLPAAPLALRDATEPGDVCAFVDGFGALGNAGTLYLTGGGAPDEFQRYARLHAVTDADGYYRLPPLHRVARVSITVDDGGNTQTFDVEPAYGETEQRLDVVYAV